MCLLPRAEAVAVLYSTKASRANAGVNTVMSDGQFTFGRLVSGPPIHATDYRSSTSRQHIIVFPYISQLYCWWKWYIHVILYFVQQWQTRWKHNTRAVHNWDQHIPRIRLANIPTFATLAFIATMNSKWNTMFPNN